jgi:hypothetical protein
VPTTSQPTIRIKLTRNGGDAVGGEAIRVLDSNGLARARVTTDAQGEAELPVAADGQAVFTVGPSSRLFRADLGQVQPERPVEIEAPPATRPTTRMYGQLVDRSGQPAAGVGLAIVRDDDATLASTVSDSNGGFALVFAPPHGSDREYSLRLSVNEKPIGLPDLPEVKAGLYGPHTFVVEKPASRRVAVAPRVQLLAAEEELVDAFMNARQLFARPETARSGDPCAPGSPAEIPSRVIALQQVVMFPPRMPSGDPGRVLSDAIDFAAPVGAEVPGELRFGAALEFRQEWWDYGYSLGDLLYSVPLAPCEQTKIATVDWRRRDYATRQSALEEGVFQDTTITRDEAINEIVRMISTKHVEGSSEGWGAGASLGPLSGGYATSVASMDDSTNAGTDASRFINDRIQQVSNTLRNTRAFAIVEATEAEESTVRTRVLRNHNHSHTLTFQYYQVVRHFLIATALRSARPAVFVPFRVLQFGPESLSRYGYLIRRALLDPTLEPVVDRLLGVIEDEPQEKPKPPAPATGTTAASDPAVTELRVRGVPTGGAGNPPVPPVFKDEVHLVIGDDEVAFSSSYTFRREEIAGFALPMPAKLSAITRIGLQNISTAVWKIDGAVFEANVGTRAQPQWHELLSAEAIELKAGGRYVHAVEAPGPATPTEPHPTEKPVAGVTRLLDHLNANPTHYTAAIIGGGDAGLRYLALARHTDTSGNPLSEIVENTVAGVAGNYLAFPLRAAEYLPEQFRGTDTSWLAAPPQRRVVTVPTPGVFAEAQLGSCNASEKIDDTRFWDWQKSPCPDEAPDITEGMLSSRYQDLKDVLEIVKSDLQPPAVQIPEEPEPMIKIGDATLSQLVKGLDLTQAGDVLSFVSGLVNTSADGFAKMMDAISGDGGGAPAGGGAAGGNGATGGEAAGGAGEAGGVMDAGITPTGAVA